LWFSLGLSTGSAQIRLFFAQGPVYNPPVDTFLHFHNEQGAALLWRWLRAGKSNRFGVRAIEKAFWQGLHHAAGFEGNRPIAVISHGCHFLSTRRWVWEFPRGRVVEIFDRNHSGKTPSPCRWLLRRKDRWAWQRSSMPSTRSIPRMQENWGGCGQPLVSQPDYGEQALENYRGARAFRRN